MKNKTTCLYPGCGKESLRRGLCYTHYGYACILVRKGKVDWATLETQGKALPRLIGGRKVSSWFLLTKPADVPAPTVGMNVQSPDDDDGDLDDDGNPIQ